MEEVIKKILTIEKKAQAIIDKAEKEKLDKQSELKERLALLEKEVVKNSHRKIKEIRKLELEEAQQKATSIINNCSNKMALLEGNYEDNRDKWTAELVESVLKR